MRDASMSQEQLQAPDRPPPPNVSGKQPPSVAWRSSIVGKVAFGIGNCIQFVLIGLLLDLLLFTDVEINAGLKLALLAFLIFGIAKRQAWLLLVAIQCALFFRDVRNTSLMLNMLSYIYATTVLILLLFTFRLEKYSEFISGYIADKIMGVISGEKKSWQQTHRLSSDAVLPSLAKLASRIIAFAGVILLASIVIRYLPFAIDRQKYLLSAAQENDYMMWPGSGVLVFALGLFLVIREFFWRRATPLQAVMYLRGLHLREHNVEIGSVIRRRAKIEQKKKKQAQKKRKKK